MATVRSRTSTCPTTRAWSGYYCQAAVGGVSSPVAETAVDHLIRWRPWPSSSPPPAPCAVARCSCLHSSRGPEATPAARQLAAATHQLRDSLTDLRHKRLEASDAHPTVVIGANDAALAVAADQKLPTCASPPSARPPCRQCSRGCASHCVRITAADVDTLLSALGVMTRRLDAGMQLAALGIRHPEITDVPAASLPRLTPSHSGRRTMRPQCPNCPASHLATKESDTCSSLG